MLLYKCVKANLEERKVYVLLLLKAFFMKAKQMFWQKNIIVYMWGNAGIVDGG